jgi:hypothetical protein
MEWAQMLAASPTWQAELEQAGPARVAQCLMFGPAQMQHVRYLVAEGLQEKQRLLQQEVVCSRAAFKRQYPRFMSWQAAQARAAPKAATSEQQEHSSNGTGVSMPSKAQAVPSSRAGEATARARAKLKPRSARQRSRDGGQSSSRAVSSSSQGAGVQASEELVAHLMAELLPGQGGAAAEVEQVDSGPDLQAGPQHQLTTGADGSPGTLFDGLALQAGAGPEAQANQRAVSQAISINDTSNSKAAGTEAAGRRRRQRKAQGS